MMKMNITYYGHSCFLVEQGGKRLIIDPFLSGNPHAGVDPSVVKVDAILLTHGHDDHFGDTLAMAKNNDCPVIATFELAMYCHNKGAKVHAMNIGGAYDFDGYRIKWTQAFHGSSIREGDQYLYAGQPAGILLTMGDKTFFHAGDTSLFSDMKMIGERHKIDVAALPIGDNYTMGPDDALTAAEWLQAPKVIPVHYDTFPVIKQDASAFAQACGDIGIHCIVMNSGDQITI